MWPGFRLSPQIPPSAGVGWHNRTLRNGPSPSKPVYRLPFLPIIITDPFCGAYPALLHQILPKVPNKRFVVSSQWSGSQLQKSRSSDLDGSCTATIAKDRTGKNANRLGKLGDLLLTTDYGLRTKEKRYRRRCGVAGMIGRKRGNWVVAGGRRGKRLRGNLGGEMIR